MIDVPHFLTLQLMMILTEFKTFFNDFIIFYHSFNFYQAS